MATRPDDAIERLASVFDGWPEVRAVGVNRWGDDRYDPYFSLSFDVYVTDTVREPETRALAFGEVGAFESTLAGTKDRFFIDDLPIRVEYKRTERFDELVTSALAGECRLRDTGTYAFRRVTDAQVALSRGHWLESIRSSLASLPNGFWSELRRAQQARAEHLYADVTAAAVRNDAFYFVLSSGAFLVSLCALLFALNRAFEPAPRAMYRDVVELPMTPDGLRANLENFIRLDPALTIGQRAELAELMIRGVVRLVPSPR